MNHCLDYDSTRFLARQMTEAETSDFESHLEHCATCQRALEESAGSDELWREARELLVYQTDSSHGSARFDAGLADSTDGVGADTEPGAAPLDGEWHPACTSEFVRSILAPSDDPAMVGRLGSYEISGILGRGAAGIVLKGFDRALNRNVAVKVLDPSMAGVGAARQRFAREARAMAAVSHEHVTPVYEVNEHKGLPFFAMEYVPGGSLERRLKAEGPLDPISIVRIGLQTALALAAAHKQGLVHRDIKPGNILLDRGADRVRVADFGLVRVTNDVTCTRSGFVTGTPQYMSPEQVCAELCDGQSDLFSLGAVMYSLATGHPPFRAETVYGVMQRIVHDEPRSIGEQNAAIPAWLEGFIVKLLAKKRGDRFASADEAARILERELVALQNPTQPAPPRPWFTPPRRKRSSPPSRTLLVSGGALAALLLLSAAFLLTRNSDPPASRGVDPRDESSSNVAPGDAGVGDDPARSGADVAVQPATAPLWNADGFAEADQLAKFVDQAVQQLPPAAPLADEWQTEFQDLNQRIDLLMQDFPESQIETFNPSSVDQPIKE